ncbi:hypothetical protein ARMGADRAFT_1080729 [Armillaria gallica]|uniref:Uncharacterized protein n=1 Tax=Armillaria gallica TaxID=47427 RepID=A0A2H3DEV9_ARMGA|nr:hypothetical protein ARMGADRAFT_1080729 [Armillaria gallica]
MSALIPPDLLLKDYKALTNKAKEAWVEKLKQNKLVHLLKVEALKKEKEETERKAEEKRQEDEQLWLKAEKAEAKRKENEWLQLKAETQALESQQLDKLAKEKKKKKKKEQENKENELALQAAGALSVSDSDSEMDPVDLKAATMAKLKRRQKIAQALPLK